MTTVRSTRRIVYASLPTTRHSGGVHVLTQHVHLLRAAGHDATIWLPGTDERDRPTWFDADVPVRFGPAIDVAADDLLVLPEVPVVPGRDPAPGARKVVLNQNHFYTFAAAGPAGSGPSVAYPGWDPPPAVWTVSQESHAVLGALHPDLPVTLVPNPVDVDLFVPRPIDRPGIAWLPRKRPREASILERLFASDARLAGVDLHPIVDVPLASVAEILGAATVFVSLGHSEGFGLPVAEALAAGCLVVGYDGGGGHELFDAPGAWAVPEQRPLLLVERVADLVRRAPSLRDVAAANRAFVVSRYTPARTAPALMAAVDAAFERPGAAARATHPFAWLPELAPNFAMSG